MMRVASVLLVAVLLSTSVISGTFAKYTTQAGGTDDARVAKWGFKPTTISFEDLFKTTAEANKAVSGNTEDIIAPGTQGSASFGFTFGGENGITAPEVAYTFTVSTEGSLCDSFIAANKNIQWKLDNGDWGTYDALISAIKALAGDTSGSKQYTPNQLPAAFNTTGANTHTIYWQWLFEDTAQTPNIYYVNETSKAIATAAGDGITQMTQDQFDTFMGNMDELDDVSIAVTITATQVD